MLREMREQMQLFRDEAAILTTRNRALQENFARALPAVAENSELRIMQRRGSQYHERPVSPYHILATLVSQA